MRNPTRTENRVANTDTRYVDSLRPFDPTLFASISLPLIAAVAAAAVKEKKNPGGFETNVKCNRKVTLWFTRNIHARHGRGRKKRRQPQIA